MNSFTDIPKDFIDKWQGIANLLAKVIAVPAALIMKTEKDFMEVFISSQSENNPYTPGDKEQWYGLYCETVIKSQKELYVPNALKDKDWDHNPDLKLGMIAYQGLPLNFPDKTPFGTICVLNNKEKHFTEEEKQLLLHFKTVIELDLALIQSLNVDKTDNLIDKLLLQNKELAAAKENAEENEKELRYRTEEYETINEELRQTNEELLQAKDWAEASENDAKSKNEEYESINEELKQTNEELFEAKERAEEGERALKHFHDLMQYIIEHSRSAIAVHDKDFKYIYVSKRYLQEYKLKEKDILGRHHYDVFPDLPQKWRDVHKKVLAG
ncbi:MAG: PAS domain-containing protein, partial [Salinivirgaceae bacterium]